LSNKIFGYARVSTAEQNLDRQLAILNEYGVQESDVYADKISGKKKQRPALNELQTNLRNGDTVITESLSRLSRSSTDLLNILSDWDKKGIIYISIKERFDLSTPVGAMMLTVMAALAQFERDVTHSRVMEGIAAAKARGRVGGRPRTDPKKLEKALRLYDSNSYSVREITEITTVSQGVLYSALRERKKQADQDE